MQHCYRWWPVEAPSTGKWSRIQAAAWSQTDNRPWGPDHMCAERRSCRTASYESTYQLCRYRLIQTDFQVRMAFGQSYRIQKHMNSSLRTQKDKLTKDKGKLLEKSSRILKVKGLLSKDFLFIKGFHQVNYSQHFKKLF